MVRPGQASARRPSDTTGRSGLGESRRLTPRRYEHFAEWARRFHEIVRGRMASCRETSTPLWHGELPDRQYMPRHAILVEHDFDPYRDIAIDEHGCWRWSSDEPALHEAMMTYFKGRREDGRPERDPGDGAPS